MIELNKKYTGKQLAKDLFDIADGTFKNDKEGYLKYMTEFFDGHKEGSRYVFTAIKKEGVPRPKGRKRVKEQAIQDYGVAIHDLLKVEPWNTGAGIARDIIFNNEYISKTYHHKVPTAYNYTRPIVKKDYDIVERKGKGYFDGVYVDMSEEELLEGRTLMNACFGNRKDISLEQDLAVMHDAGDITDQEYQEALAKINDNKYQAALDMGKMKYGYRPVRVNKYENKMIAFSEKEKDKGE